MEVAALLGTRNVKGIGAALSGTRNTLSAAGIRMDEAAMRRTVRGRSVWTGGPRIRQAMHVLEQERYRWTGGDGREDVPIEDARQEDPAPVLVLRALKSRGNVYRIDGGMAELDEILEDDRFEIGDARRESIGEIFVAGIEPGKDGREHPVPDGYGENGIWVRGEHDYAEPRVPGAIGTGLWSTMISWVGEATWVERRIPFVDARRQVAKVRAENSRSFSGGCNRTLAGHRGGCLLPLCELDRSARPRRAAPRAAAADAAAVLVRGRDRDGEGQTHRVARGRACAATPRARRAGRSGAGASCKVRGKASRSRSASSGSRRGSPGPCPRTGRRAVRAPITVGSHGGTLSNGNAADDGPGPA